MNLEIAEENPKTKSYGPTSLKRMAEICRWNGCKLFKDDQCRDNACYLSLNVVYYGEYKDKTLRAISILHELGHFKSHDYNHDSKLAREVEAWAIAFRLAKQYKIEYSPAQAQWCISNLLTYCKEEYL